MKAQRKPVYSVDNLIIVYRCVFSLLWLLWLLWLILPLSVHDGILVTAGRPITR